MALQTVWYETRLPKTIIDEMVTTLSEFDKELTTSLIDNNLSDLSIRDAKHFWISDSHWIAGFLWHFVNKSNRENFLYDLSEIENACLQYTVYTEGNFYKWHADQDLDTQFKPKILGSEIWDNTFEKKDEFLSKNTESIRKLTVSIQLSDYDEYEGGNLELKDFRGNVYTAPRTKGAIIVYDSRTVHQITPITSGTRKSLVCWIAGPRWN